jgi:hypothetical protein
LWRSVGRREGRHALAIPGCGGVEMDAVYRSGARLVLVQRVLFERWNYATRCRRERGRAAMCWTWTCTKPTPPDHSTIARTRRLIDL